MTPKKRHGPERYVSDVSTAVFRKTSAGILSIECGCVHVRVPVDSPLQSNARRCLGPIRLNALYIMAEPAASASQTVCCNRENGVNPTATGSDCAAI